MDKRGISPLIATVLLIGLVILIALIILMFLRNISDEQMETQQEQIDIYTSGNVDFNVVCDTYTLDTGNGVVGETRVLITNNDNSELYIVLQGDSEVYDMDELSENPVDAYQSEIFRIDDLLDSVKVVPHIEVDGEIVAASAQSIERSCSVFDVADLISFDASCESEGFLDQFDSTFVADNTGGFDLKFLVSESGETEEVEVGGGSAEIISYEGIVGSTYFEVYVPFLGQDVHLDEFDQDLSCGFTNYMGSALCFDGVDDFIEVLDLDDNLDLFYDFVIEYWFYNPETTGRENIYTRFDSDIEGIYTYFEGENIGFHVGDSIASYENNISYNVDANFTFYNISVINISNGVDRWNHVAFDFGSSDAIEFYLNNQKTFVYITLTSGAPQYIELNLDNDLMIGSGYGDNYFSGCIDEVRLWANGDLAKSSDRFDELTGSEEGLIAYYKFNDEGDLGKDYSTWGGHNNDGTDYNGPTTWTPS
jgi:hypothetical protein